MSSFLTRVLFPEKSNAGMLSRLVDAFRIPTHEEQMAEIEHNRLHAMASKLAEFYPTPDHIPNPHDPAKQRRKIEITVGCHGDDQYRQVMELYRSEYAAETSDVPIPNHARDNAHDEMRSRWDRLNEAVGGDLWTNPYKQAAMRKVDDGNIDPFNAEEFQAFHDKLVEAVERIDFNAPAPRTEKDKEALEREAERLGLNEDQRYALTFAQFEDGTRFFDRETFEFREGSVRAWLEQHGNDHEDKPVLEM